ncbi:MAG TPA: ABC transporter permease, partial [Methylomirabilota bacterium]|nr:ABC transporter permease [Methylomirabilota bacterium]
MRSGPPPSRPGSWRRAARSPLFLVAGTALAALVAVGLLADRVAPYPPTGVDAARMFQGPSPRHPFGT